MAFDAFFLSAVLDEMRQSLDTARVEKIQQPSRDTVILTLKSRETRQKLLFSGNPTAPRLHLTEANPENPAEPPMFCMLLRKHLIGARLREIQQIPMERWVCLSFDSVNELGDPTTKKLVAELMGRTCNLYLLDEDDRITDCLRRVGLDEAKRPALPGMFYQMPEPVTKQDPSGDVDYVNLLSAPGSDILAERLMDTLGGLSPLVCREAALFAAGDTDARITGSDIPATADKLALFFGEHLRHSAPYLYRAADGTPKQFAFCPIRQYGTYEQADSFGKLLDAFYTVRDQKDAMRQRSQALRKTVSKLCQRLTRKLAVQEKELQETHGRERLRQLGDILTANLHNIRKGQETVTVEDFYDENMALITVKLSPILSPQQNAAKYYKDYNRMKNAEKELTRQMELGNQELQYLQSILEELERAGSDAELEEIRRELQDGGYVRQDSGRKRMKAAKVPFLRFESTDGYPIYVGKNNRQNEELTFKLARKDDLWLHAQKVHGSHVIISCGGTTPPDDTVTQAAQLAAYYSGAGKGQNLPVDVTPVKQVKHPGTGKPGMVIYHTYRTVYVNPYPDIRVDALNAEKKPNEE